MKSFMFALAFVFLSCSAKAQQIIQPCILVTTNGITTCQPISTANPIPVVSQ